jgi:hypothetical protein
MFLSIDKMSMDGILSYIIPHTVLDVSHNIVDYAIYEEHLPPVVRDYVGNLLKDLLIQGRTPVNQEMRPNQ